MRRGLKLQNYPITKLPNRQRGYILITLMLFFALIAMAAIAVLPDVAFQIKRDREEEMRHRGTEYMRAIKRYYKKFNRYPARVEELENTNNLRFIRKRYKDPLFKDRDFKLIRLGDPGLNMLGMGGIGQNPALQLPGQNVPPPAPGLGPGSPQQPGSKPPAADSENAEAQDDSKADDSSPSASGPGGQAFGGGAILGVASLSKQKAIREFNHKNHYKDWFFIYDPKSDVGGLLTGPIQPDLNRSMGLGQPANAGQGTQNPPQGATGQPQQPGPQPPAEQPPEQ